MPRVSRNQVRILLAHLDLIENDVLGVGEGFVSDLGTVEVQAMIKKHLQKKRDSLSDCLLCGRDTNYRTIMEDILEVEEFRQWLKGWDE